MAAESAVLSFCRVVLPKPRTIKNAAPTVMSTAAKHSTNTRYIFSFTSIPARVVCFAMIFPFRSWQGCLVSIRGVMPLYFLTSIHKFYFTPFCASAPVVSVFFIFCTKMAPAICGRCHSGNIFYRLFSMAALILVYRLRAAGLLCAERAPAPGTAPQRTRWTAES